MKWDHQYYMKLDKSLSVIWTDIYQNDGREGFVSRYIICSIVQK